MKLIEALGIDYKLLLAQVVNFLILLFILYKFAYRPILNMLEKRRKMVDDSVKNAEKIEKEKLAIEEIRREAIAAARKESIKIIESAKEKSAKIKSETIQSAQKESKDLLDKTRNLIEAEKKAKIEELKKEIADLVLLATSNLIKKKLDQGADNNLIDQAIKEKELN